MNGKLILCVEASSVTVKTFFNKLNPHYGTILNHILLITNNFTIY